MEYYNCFKVRLAIASYKQWHSQNMPLDITRICLTITWKVTKETQTMKKKIPKIISTNWHQTLLNWCDYKNTLHSIFAQKVKTNNNKRERIIITLKCTQSRSTFSLLFTVKHGRDPIRGCHFDIGLNMRRKREGSHCNLFKRSDLYKVSSSTTLKIRHDQKILHDQL